MEKVDLLYDFVDGKLDPIQEDMLFTALASNESLRVELKELMTLETAFRNDAGSLNYSAESTAAIYNRLGFSVPKGLGPAATGIGSGIVLFFRNYYPYVLTGLSTAVITTVLMLSILGSDNATVINEKAGVIYSGNNIGAAAEAKLPMENAEAFDMGRATERLSRGNIVGAMSDGGAEQEPLSQQIVTEDQDLDDHITDALVTQSGINNAGLYALLGEGHYTPGYSEYVFDIHNYDLSDIELDEHTKIGLILELRGSNDWHYPYPEIKESVDPRFANTALTIFYKISNDFSLGLDLRQEFFYQEYEGDIDATQYKHMQVPNFLSFGLCGRYKFYTINNFSAFAQLYAGFNRGGLAGRAGLGIIYSPGKDYSFILGLEGSMLGYHHQNSVFTSNKLGLFYGASFNL